MVPGRPLSLLVVALSVGCGGNSVRHGATGGGGGKPPFVSDGGVVAAAGKGGSPATPGVGGSTAATAGTGGTTSGGGGESAATGGTGMGGQGEAPGCPPDKVEECDPGPGAWCSETICYPDAPTVGIFIERGAGTLCKAFPDSTGPDFGCMQGEWCQWDLHECRCGRHEGCQLGERCAPCADDRCASDDYECVRDVPCTEDNLDTCAAEPGQVCAPGALTCSEPALCMNGDGIGASLCPGAPSGCCPTAEWCFDGRECRCGVGPSCAEGDACELNSVGLYRCGGRIR